MQAYINVSSLSHERSYADQQPETIHKLDTSLMNQASLPISELLWIIDYMTDLMSYQSERAYNCWTLACNIVATLNDLDIYIKCIPVIILPTLHGQDESYYICSKLLLLYSVFLFKSYLSRLLGTYRRFQRICQPDTCNPPMDNLLERKKEANAPASAYFLS